MRATPGIGPARLPTTPPTPRLMTPGPVPAYQDAAFLDSDHARPVRILAEYLQPLRAFERENVHDTVVFFGSARLGEDGPLGRYYRDARELARRLTEWSLSLQWEAQRFVVCTGGGPGIMEAANRGARDAGGRSIGLNIGLPHEQRPNAFITDGLSFEFHYFFTRKLWFAHLARAMVAFPGGLGTLDEVCEILTLVQTRKLPRPIPVVLYGRDFWSEVLDVGALLRHGMIAPGDLALFQYVDEPGEAFATLQQLLRGDVARLGPHFAPSSTTCCGPDATLARCGLGSTTPERREASR